MQHNEKSGYGQFRNRLFSVARPKRFELLAYRFVACCSIQLSYERVSLFLLAFLVVVNTFFRVFYFFVARPKRFELLTYRFVACCSIQLSYERVTRLRK